MKKLFLVLFVTTIVTTAKAQKIYVQGGFNVANISKNNKGETNDNNNLLTFNVGLLGRLDLSKVFDLEASVLFTGRGAKAETYFTNSKEDNYLKAKFNPYYIEVPVNAVLKFPISADGKTNIFVHAGPYVAMGIAGRSKTESKFLGITSSSNKDIQFNDDDPSTDEQEGAAYDKVKRFDFGANVGAGIDFGKLLIRANYGLGFTKIGSTQTNDSDNDKSKYRTFSLSIGIPLND